MSGKRTTTVLAFVVIAQLVGNHWVTADILCYACNSYMSQCQPELLVSDIRNVFKARCSGKCFIRQGEDNATYRGCFDGFSSVVDLTDGYLGCRSQTWNNKQRQWCLCDSDLCNVHFDLQSPLSTSLHHRHPPPPVAHGNGVPPPSPPSLGHHISSKHPSKRPSQDPRSEFFESFADKAKYRQSSFSSSSSAVDAPSDSLIFPVEYVQPRTNEAGAGRNQTTNYRERRPLDHFKEQDDQDVLIEEPIAFNHIQDKRHDDMTSSRGSLPLPGQTKKESQDKSEDERLSEGIAQITYDVDTMSVESHDYPYNQEKYRAMTLSPRVSALEVALDDLNHRRKLDRVQADGSANHLQNNDSTTVKVVYGRTDAGTEGKELKTTAQRDLEKGLREEQFDRAFTEDAVDPPELSEDYPYNQIFNQELAKEDLELLTKPRPFELRFSQTQDPSSESAQKPESSKSAHEVENWISKGQDRESTNRLEESPVRIKEFGRKEFLSPNDLFRSGNLNYEQKNPPQPNQGNEINGFDALARLAIHDADILWVGQGRAPDDTDPKHELDKETPNRHQMERENKNGNGEDEETRSGREAGPNEDQILDRDEQDAKKLKKIGVDGRTGVLEKQNEEEELSFQTNRGEQTTLKAATTIRCFRTGYYDNPTDCTQFIACLLDPRSRAYILHFMRCPAGLFWDNTRKLCMESSSTCYINSRNQGNGANSVISPEDGVQLRQKHLLLSNGRDAL